jgi:GNAT superfamily N-acetyltransferase
MSTESTPTLAGTPAPAHAAGGTRLPDGVHLFDIEAPSPDDVAAGPAITTAFRAIADIDGEYVLELFGNTDLQGTPDVQVRALADRSAVEHRYTIAARGPVADALAARGVTTLPAVVPAGQDDPTPAVADVLAYVGHDFDLLDNTSTIGVEITVRKADRRQGIGAALWDHAVEEGQARGRTIVQAWVDHAVPTADEPTLRPTRSEGEIPVDVPARFVTARDLVLEQIERHSVLTTAGRKAEWESALVEAMTRAADTDEVVTWDGYTPEKDLEHMALLMRRMSTDTPLGGLDWDEEEWDATRVRTAEEVSLGSGRRARLTTAIRDTTTGALVAFTQIAIPLGTGAAWQNETLVMKEHRGRRLGTIVKLVNQLALLERYPDAERIHTWNAFENSYMLDVNHAVGFELVSLAGAWQGRLA